jgi:ribosomal protein L32
MEYDINNRQETQAVSIDKGRLSELFAECREAARVFGGVHTGLVEDPLASWSALEAAFWELLSAPEEPAPKELPGETEASVSDTVLALRTSGDTSEAATATLIHASRDSGLVLCRWNPGPGFHLASVQWHAVGKLNLTIQPCESGWEVASFGERLVHYHIDPAGKAVDMSAESVMTRENLSWADYLDRIRPGITAKPATDEKDGPMMPSPKAIDTESMGSVFERLNQALARAEDESRSIAGRAAAGVAASVAGAALEALRQGRAQPAMSTVDMKPAGGADVQPDVTPDTDPRFVEASGEFWKLRKHFESGAILRARFEEEVEKLKLRDESGDWWTIDRENGNWLRFDGRAWVPSAPPRVKPSPEEKPSKTPAREGRQERKQPEPKPARTPEPAATPEPDVCPSCGTVVRIGNRFCQYCGLQVKGNQEQKTGKKPEAPPVPICSRCGDTLRPGVKFCTRCGAPVMK